MTSINDYLTSPTHWGFSVGNPPPIGTVREGRVWTGRVWAPYSEALESFLTEYAVELAKMNAGGIGEFSLADVFTKREGKEQMP